MEKTMQIEGMHCGGCSGRAKRALEALPGVESVIASHATNSAVVKMTADIDNDTLKKAVEAEGFIVHGIE